MAATTRAQKTAERRALIASAAIDLFDRQGFAKTTFDDIATATGVSRRTIFRYFPTKEAILFDNFVVRNEATVARLRERPDDEPPLVSLHAVLREVCQQGYDRRLLAQIRSVLDTEPMSAAGAQAAYAMAFEDELIAALVERDRDGRSEAQLRPIALMALSWLSAAAHMHLVEGGRSLLKCFDDSVATCLQEAQVLARS